MTTEDEVNARLDAVGDAIANLRSPRGVYIVAFVDTGDGSIIPDPPSPQAYAFEDPKEADQFAVHMMDLYGFEVAVSANPEVIHTYDTAIAAVVEDIGPSPE